jgi:uncharacterized protein (UPF0216 family)
MNNQSQWDRALLKEFRVIAADGTVREIRKDELRARIALFSSEAARKPLRDLFRGETDDVTLENGDRYLRIAWPDLVE